MLVKDHRYSVSRVTTSPRRAIAWYPTTVVVALGGLLLGVVSGSGSIVAGAAGATAVLLVARLLTPAFALTALLLVFAVVPFDYLPARAPLAIVSPLIILLGLVAAATGGPPPHWLRGVWLAPPVAFAIYTIILPVLQPHGQLQTVASWTVVVIVALIAVPLWMTDATVFRPVTRALLLIAVGLAVVGGVEYVTHSNPYSVLFANAPFPLVQEWSVYRIMTTLGHPLVNSTFFAAVGSLAFGLFLTRARLGLVIAFAASCSGILLSGSRGGLLAIGVGVLFAGAVATFRLTANRLLRLLLAFVPLVAIIVVVGPASLDSRSDSEEGRTSADARSLVLQIALKVARTTIGVFGSGGGLSGTVFRENGGGDYVLESSVWQVVFSYGVIGAALLLSYIVVVLARSIARGAIAGPAMLVAYSVSASSFNLFESAPAALIIPAVAIILTISEARTAHEGAPVDHVRTSDVRRARRPVAAPRRVPPSIVRSRASGRRSLPSGVLPTSSAPNSAGGAPSDSSR